MYSQASPEHDHKLEWDLFRLSELSCFDAMMSRLYKLELEALVMKYEACRSVGGVGIVLPGCRGVWGVLRDGTLG